MSKDVAETDTELALRQRLKDELPYYAETCLKIRSKAGRIEPLNFNAVQRYIHERVEAQPATQHVQHDRLAVGHGGLLLGAGIR